MSAETGTGKAFIVHWREIVGEDFLDEFCRIAKALVYAPDQDAVDKIMEAKTEDVREHYKRVRRRMMRCGYYIDALARDLYHECGWNDAYLNRAGEVCFHTYGAPVGGLISMRSYMDHLRERAQKDGKGESRYEELEDERWTA
jgi:hypothetical protein